MRCEPMANSPVPSPPMNVGALAPSRAGIPVFNCRVHASVRRETLSLVTWVSPL